MAAQPHDEVAFEKWRFGSIVSTGKNARCIPVNDGTSFPATPPKIQLCTDHDPALEIVQMLREGESWSLTVRVPEESPLLRSLQSLDHFALKAAETQSVELFKKQFKNDQLLQLYRPLVKDSLLSLSVNADDVQVWKLLDAAAGDDIDKKFCDATLDDLVPGVRVWLCAEVKAFYFLPRSFGIALSASDVLVIPVTRPKVFPFVSRTRRFSYAPPVAANASSPEPEEAEEEDA
jgi:hypothetical protein